MNHMSYDSKDESTHDGYSHTCSAGLFNISIFQAASGVSMSEEVVIVVGLKSCCHMSETAVPGVGNEMLGETRKQQG